jgi:two-component system sensor histidine kinase/response regulator
MERTGKATILIVDDNQANLIALEHLLENDNRIVLPVNNGREALKITLSQEIDLIILDVKMPDMDGFEVAQILKSNKKTREIPIIFASAERKEHKFLIKGYEEGAVDYLFKPLDPDIAKAKVAVLLQLQLQKRELIAKNLEIKKLNEDLQNAVYQLKETNKELESFSYSVSHDLRTPLRAINGYSKIIKEDYSHIIDDEANRLFGVVQENAERMELLIDDLLEFSKLGRKPVAKSKINMEEMVKDVLNEITKSSYRKSDVKIHSLLPGYGDFALINQVWINLISNALKYSAKKQKPEIEIGSTESNSEVVYYIKDNGAGFDMEYVDKLFGVFQRLHADNEFEGTGVGLAIVHRVITKHGGKVWAESEIDKGASFYFTL